MEFRVLGPLEVRGDGGAIELRGSKRRAVLALLVLHANEVVRAARLIEEVWGEEPPANAAAALRNHVSRLRKDLGGDVLVTKPWGYVLRTDPEAIDLHQFERLVAEAKPLAAQERAALLAEALALWRGPALVDLALEPALAVEIARLDELRLAAIEQRIDADLEFGRHEELIAELEALVAEQPLRERLRGQLILALYRSGRQAEALETYRETRRVLVEELGIEPSSELRELERAILRQDPALASAPSPPEEVDAEIASSRWRWPRSPLLLGAVLLLLAGAGASAGIVATRGAGSSGKRAAPTRRVAAPPPATAARRSNIPRGRVRRTTPAHSSSKKPRTGATIPALLGGHPRASKQQTRTRTKPAATPRSKPAKAPSPKVYSLADNFEDPAFDYSMWHLVNSKGVDAAERNGQLEVSVDPQAVAQGMSFDTHYGTQCRLMHDFDARVEFKLLRWPPGNGMYLTLGAYFGSWPPPLDWMSIARMGEPANGGSEAYATSVRSDNRNVQTSDMDGALRVRRVNGILSTYYRHQQSWVKLGSGIAPHPALLILSVSSNPDQFGHQAVAAAFDNFQATADAVDCAGVPLPPLKPRP